MSSLRDEPVAVYASVTGPLTNWLTQAVEIGNRVRFAYVPAASSIAFWYRDTTVPDKVTTIASAIAISSPLDRISRRPNITRSLVVPEAFSPNGDGRKDVTEVSAFLSLDADWTVEVRDAGRTIRTFSGQGNSIETTWEGLDEADTLVEDGLYTIELTAIDPSSGLSAVPVRIEVRLDRTAPTAEIVNPSEGTTVGRLVSVIGTADDRDLQSYTLEVGEGVSPSSFTRLELGSMPAINNRLGVWDTETGDDGPYTLKLVAEDRAGNISSFTRAANVSNPGRDVTPPLVAVTTPAAGSDLSGTFPIEVEATDNVQVTRVELYVDTVFEKAFTAPPYTHTVRSTRLRNGDHVIQAKAFDAKGNVGVSDDVVMTTTNPISEFTVTPGVISPNGDGVDDFTAVKARLPVGEPWTLTIRDGSDEAVRTFSSSTSTISQVWNGRNDGGELVADAGYRVRLETATVSEELDVAVENIDHPPTVSFSYPKNGAKLTGMVKILGTATDRTFESYTLEYRHVEQEEWTVLETSNRPIVQGVLGTLDTTLLQNDPYLLRLTAVDGSQFNSKLLTVYPTGDLKVGNFELTFTDLMIPVSGIPITVTRTYRSLDKAKGDFGIGWNLTYGTQYTIDPEFNVTMNLPDGRRATFFIGIDYRDPKSFQQLRDVPYEAEPGVHAKLRWDVVSFLLNQETFTLETKEGDRYNYSHGLLRSVRTRNGNELTFDAGGISHQSGTGITFERDGENRIEAVVDPLGNRIEYGYDTRGDLVSVTDGEGNLTKFTYNGNHGLLSIEDPENRLPMRSEYDDKGRLIRTIDRRGNAIEVGHDLVSRRALITDRNGAPTVYEYDTRGLVTTIKDALGGTKTFEYDEAKNLTAEVDELGNRTEYDYDSRGNRTKEKRFVEGRPMTTEFTYGIDNNLTSMTDPLGRKTTQTYDSEGNLTSMTDPLGNTTQYEYDDAGNVIQQMGPDGSIVTNTFDPAGNPLTETTVVGGDSQTTEFTYDLAGNRETEEDPRGHVTRFVYDKNHRVTEVHDPLGTSGRRGISRRASFGPRWTKRVIKRSISTKIRVEDSRGLPFARTDSIVLQQEDQAGNLTREEVRKVGEPEELLTTRSYDAKKQLTKINHPDGTSTQNEYDEAGRLTAVIDERDNRTQFTYDELGRQIAVRSPVGDVTKFEYDDAGNRKAVIDPKGNRTDFEYDAANRLVRTTFPDGTVQSVAYDALGRKIAETDQAFRTTQFGYDEAGRLTSVTDALGNVTRYEYDAAGNRTTIIDANSHRTEFEYDERNQLEKKIWPDGKFESYTYESSGLLETKTDAKGQTIEYTYDEMGRLEEKNYPDGTFVRFTYTRTGQRWTVEDVRGVTRYSYDLRDRLTELAYPDGGKSPIRTMRPGTAPP